MREKPVANGDIQFWNPAEGAIRILAGVGIANQQPLVGRVRAGADGGNCRPPAFGRAIQ